MKVQCRCGLTVYSPLVCPFAPVAKQVLQLPWEQDAGSSSLTDFPLSFQVCARLFFLTFLVFLVRALIELKQYRCIINIPLTQYRYRVHLNRHVSYSIHKLLRHVQTYYTMHGERYSNAVRYYFMMTPLETCAGHPIQVPIQLLHHTIMNRHM